MLAMSNAPRSMPCEVRRSRQAPMASTTAALLSSGSAAAVAASALTSGQSRSGVECPTPCRSTTMSRRPVRWAIGASPPYHAWVPRSRLGLDDRGLRRRGRRLDLEHEQPDLVSAGKARGDVAARVLGDHHDLHVVGTIRGSERRSSWRAVRGPSASSGLSGEPVQAPRIRTAQMLAIRALDIPSTLTRVSDGYGPCRHTPANTSRRSRQGSSTASKNSRRPSTVQRYDPAGWSRQAPLENASSRSVSPLAA